MTDSQRLQELERQFADANPDHRILAVRDAVNLGASGQPLLLYCLQTEKNWKVLEACIKGVASVGGSATVEGLGRFLCDKRQEKNLRAQAATALGMLGDPAGAEYLRQVLTDKSYAVRNDAQEALNALSARQDS